MKSSYFRTNCLFSLSFLAGVHGPHVCVGPWACAYNAHWINWPCMWHIFPFCQYAKGMLMPVYHENLHHYHSLFTIISIFYN